MTKIDFDEPSTGNVNSDKTALVIKNSGKSGGIVCESTNDIGGEGVVGKSKATYGIYGESARDVGVCGVSNFTIGVYGESKSENGTGVQGNSTGSGKGIGLHGRSRNWIGVSGLSGTYVGVQGEVTSNNNASGVFGVSYGDKTVNGVKGVSTGGIGVLGESRSYVAILGRAPVAGRFEGNVEVTGDIRLLNADCAEDFDIAQSENVEAGTVMVLNEMGSLKSSYQEYDKKVAGIIAGANGYKPAIVLDREHSQSQNQENRTRLPIALMGKAYCKVDARHSSVEVGDLLTTSSTKGHAMKAEDPTKAIGAIIGKALGSLKDGLGMMPVLVTLQ